MDQMTFCHSCAAPLNMPEFRGPAERYCRYCTDDQGNLKSKQEIMEAIAGWFKMWQPEIDFQTAMGRVEHYMKAMPHWAEQRSCRP